VVEVQAAKEGAIRLPRTMGWESKAQIIPQKAITLVVESWVQALRRRWRRWWTTRCRSNSLSKGFFHVPWIRTPNPKGKQQLQTQPDLDALTLEIPVPGMANVIEGRVVGL